MHVGGLAGIGVSLYDTGNQLRDHVYRRSKEAFARGDAARDAVRDPQQLRERQAFIRQAFLESTGGLPDSDTPLNARIAGTVGGDGFRIENIVFESRPRHYVTANLYIPDGLDQPGAAVLFVCGHHDQGKHTPEYQTVCQILVRAGLIVLAIDPIGQGERHTYYEPELGKSLVEGTTADHDYVGVQCLLLDTPLARYFLHDAMRAVDYLASRPEADPSRIGVTGNSGGGLQSAMMMLSDPRIAAAAPATFIMSRETYLLAGQGQDAEQIWPGFSADGLDHEDIIIAMAPKPVLILAVSWDFFTIEGTERTYSRVRRFWEMHNAADRVQLFVDESVHKYTVAMAQEAARFFAQHLLNRIPERKEPNAATVTVTDASPFDPKLLWCTVSGKVIGELEQAQTVHDTNVELMECIEQKELMERTEHMEQQEQPTDSAASPGQAGIARLRQLVFASRESVPFRPRIVPLGHLHRMEVESVLWWSQQDLFNHAVVFRDTRRFDRSHPPVIALWHGGTTRCIEHFDWIRDTCSRGAGVVVLDVTGAGAIEPRPISSQPIHHLFGTMHKLATDLIWLDDSLAAIRVYDVLRALDAIRLLGMEADRVDVYAVGRVDLYPRLAALLDARIRQIESREGIGRLRELVKAKYYNDYDMYSFLLPGLPKVLDI